MKGGRDWKICRRLLGRKTGRRGVRRGRGGAQGARSGPPQHFCQDGGPGAPDSHRALTPIVPWPVTSCLVLS